MKFNPENITELVPIRQHLENGCPVLRTRRRFTYLVYEAKDPDLFKANGVIRLGGQWYAWPAGLARYVELAAERTCREFAA